MFVRYDIRHVTTYRYRSPVRFGEHRVMFRPRDSHDLRVLATDLQVSPRADIRLIQDSHSNSVALVQPQADAAELSVACTFTIEHARSQNLELPLLPRAEVFPIAYSLDERLDLELYLRPHYDDPAGELTDWAMGFVRAAMTEPSAPTGVPRAALVAMNRHIRDAFSYTARDEEGTQTPLATLACRQGSCRDFALLMMEAARRIGIATRFVSGYLYDPALDRDLPSSPAAGVPGAATADDIPKTKPPTTQAPGGDLPTLGAGATHGWLQAYLPGAGWVPFDPTNNLLGGNTLIRVGVSRHPAQAPPVAGSWFGPADAYLGLQVEVQVRRHRS
jgi:transglutaminase-like putative cysteine protease